MGKLLLLKVSSRILSRSIVKVGNRNCKTLKNPYLNPMRRHSLTEYTIFHGMVTRFMRKNVRSRFVRHDSRVLDAWDDAQGLLKLRRTFLGGKGHERASPFIPDLYAFFASISYGANSENKDWGWRLSRMKIFNVAIMLKSYVHST